MVGRDLLRGGCRDGVVFVVFGGAGARGGDGRGMVPLWPQQ